MTKQTKNAETLSCPAPWDPWAVAHQAPLSMAFSRQEYWSGLPFGSSRPRDRTQVFCIAGRFFIDSARRKALRKHYIWLSTSELWARTCRIPASPLWAGERPGSDRPGPEASLSAQQTHWIQAPTRLPMQMSLWAEPLSVAVLCSVRITKHWLIQQMHVLTTLNASNFHMPNRIDPYCQLIWKFTLQFLA